MRLPVVIVVIIILGGSLGIARTWSEFAGIEERMELPATIQVVGSRTTDNPASSDRGMANPTGTPQAKVVGGASIDFGVMKQDETESHSFVVRNDGDADLHVEQHRVSCGLCVTTTFTDAVVKPGEEIMIPITFTTRKVGPALTESLEVRTNDKTHELIRLELVAYVSEAASASVNELALGTISTEDGAEASFRVYGFGDEPLEIIQCDLVENANSNYFEVDVDDLTHDAVKSAQSHANSGKEIKVTIKPGLPVGPLQQRVNIRARVGEEVTIGVPVSGRVTGDLSLIGGSKFSTRRSMLSIGRVLVGEGASAKLHLMVKGEHREKVQVTVGECKPAEYLSATIGERKVIQDGNVYLFPVTVEIDKSAPSINRLGGAGTETGKIIIRTTHPTAKEVALHVRFAIE